MTDNSQSPGTPPVDNSAHGQPGNQPPAAGNDQPSGGVQEPGDTPPVLSVEEINALKRKAGRWDKLQISNRKDRRNNRRSTEDYNTDGASPELLETLKDRDTKIDELSSVNVKLEVKDKVRNLLDSDEYKELPIGIRRAIVRNPLGFAGPSAHSVDEAVADIQDYLDDELDNAASGAPAPKGGDQPAPAGTPPTNPIPGQTPPAGGSGPSNLQVDTSEGVGDKTGSKRSVQVLQNILRGPKQ